LGAELSGFARRSEISKGVSWVSGLTEGEGCGDRVPPVRERMYMTSMIDVLWYGVTASDTQRRLYLS
jgi:hypothetical protein